LQVEPQALASSSAAQAVPQECHPVAQVNAQAPLVVQVTPADPAGAGHGVHEVPQEFGLVSAAHMPLQLWDPAGHGPQAAAESMQAPLQSFCVPGQVPPHVPATQVAVPPVIDGQGAHEVPQFAGSVSLRHLPAEAQ
jgi:hypothetical protein